MVQFMCGSGCVECLCRVVMAGCVDCHLCLTHSPVAVHGASLCTAATVPSYTLMRRGADSLHCLMMLGKGQASLS